VIEETEEVPEESTAQPDPAEPAGDQDPATEKEYDEAKEAAAGEAAAPEPPDLEAEAKRYLDLAQRTQAEFENYRKRAARDNAQAGERAKGNLVRELLPVVDNLERALGSAEEGEDHLAQGVRLVLEEIVAVLSRQGVEAFDPAGEQFDPELHEALSTREQEDAEAGVVLDVVEKGYRLNGNVLRPARVVVAA
jgi:molecular chaperone GrpE